MMKENPGQLRTEHVAQGPWRFIPENSVGIELGVWRGNGSAKFFEHGAAFIHMVDPWAVYAYEESDDNGGYEEYINKYAKQVGSRDPEKFQRYYDAVYQFVVNRFEGKPHHIHRMTTDEFFEGCTIQADWIYVDANHGYEECYKDLCNALKHTGLILGDDYPKKPGVKKAVDQFRAEHPELEFENFRKADYGCDHFYFRRIPNEESNHSDVCGR